MSKEPDFSITLMTFSSQSTLSKTITIPFSIPLNTGFFAYSGVIPSHSQSCYCTAESKDSCNLLCKRDFHTTVTLIQSSEELSKITTDSILYVVNNELTIDLSNEISHIKRIDLKAGMKVTIISRIIGFSRQYLKVGSNEDLPIPVYGNLGLVDIIAKELFGNPIQIWVEDEYNGPHTSIEMTYFMASAAILTINEMILPQETAFANFYSSDLEQASIPFIIQSLPNNTHINDYFGIDSRNTNSQLDLIEATHICISDTAGTCSSISDGFDKYKSYKIVKATDIIYALQFKRMRN